MRSCALAYTSSCLSEERGEKMKGFAELPAVPPDPLFALEHRYAQDSRPDRINLGIGVYADGEGKIRLLPSVHRAEWLDAERGAPRVYLPMGGDAHFCKEVGHLLLGTEASLEESVILQTPGSTGALYLIGRLLHDLLDVNKIWLTRPTWPNHHTIFRRVGMEVAELPYFDPSTRQIALDGFFSSVAALPKRSVLLLHTCCHNPTGCDLTPGQWKELTDLLVQGEHLPLLDTAYLGLAEGLEEDALPIRHLAERGIPALHAFSGSKSFGLYGERVGALLCTSVRPEWKEAIASQLKALVRATYSNPPIHGARLVAAILSDPPLAQEWREEVSAMRTRLQEMREGLTGALEARGIELPGCRAGKGFFYLLNLPKESIAELERAGCYFPSSGRINLSGLHTGNLEGVVDLLAPYLERA